ncbi:nuclear transport factor 2 family protein [Pseudooceanicola sp.]|uniref:nuclear transport factor 2 family protein n=1 Tax=Pseudooceanicola sp. TaxID=1914328 RepID=UPI002608FA25|nr:nuclear transport factor 2 family protein [Pseudooceanicola sp.]MDF1856736.1 nuclear transport factor 2 family protein [Pseudooceanicola sp.]
MTAQPMSHDPLARAGNALIRFFRALDDSDYETMVALLDGEWHRQGKVLSDRASLLAAMQGRSTTRRIHHLLSNIGGTIADDGEVTLTAYMLVLQHDSGARPEGPSPMQGFSSIRTLTARIAQTDKGWQIRWLKSGPQSFAA